VNTLIIRTNKPDRKRMGRGTIWTWFKTMNWSEFSFSYRSSLNQIANHLILFEPFLKIHN
jgi:hypothetical protein